MINLENIPPLPDKNDKLFTSESDWWNNACLNYLPDGWTLYAIGYKEAADIIIKYIDSERRYQDALVFPLVFLYRQYLELAIKDLIHQGQILLDIYETSSKTHRIDKLWKICRTLLLKISPNESGEEIKHISRLIEEFCQVDPCSMAFRYPEDKDGNPSLPGIKHINLRNVADIINKISIILDGASAQIDEYLSFKGEMGP